MEVLVPNDTKDMESPQQVSIRAETGVELGEFVTVSPGSLLATNPPASCDAGEVRDAIWRMNPRKAPGLDGITAGILRQVWPVLAKHITHAFSTGARELANFQTTGKTRR